MKERKIEFISSLANSKIKRNYKLLKDSSFRKEEGVFLIDGQREVEEALKNSWPLLEFYFCSKLIKEEKKEILEKTIKKSKKVYELSEPAFKKISYKKTPDGFIALSSIKKTTFPELKIKKDPLILILESVEKPGNLGAIIRTAYAGGVDFIILNDQQTDLFSPNVIRSSTGFVFCLPLIITSVSETISWLNKNKINLFLTSISAQDSYLKANFKKGTALVFGTEAFGLSDLWLKEKAQQIKIPMTQKMDSLNVSVSVAIIIYEALRQRKII